MHGQTRNCYAHTAYTMAEHTNNAVANGNRLVDDKCWADRWLVNYRRLSNKDQTPSYGHLTPQSQ